MIGYKLFERRKLPSGCFTRWHGPYYPCPKKWPAIRPGAVLRERCLDTKHECGPGVNFAPTLKDLPSTPFKIADYGKTWVVFEVESLAHTYRYGGPFQVKCRTSKLKLLRKLSAEEVSQWK